MKGDREVIRQLNKNLGILLITIWVVISTNNPSPR